MGTDMGTLVRKIETSCWLMKLLVVVVGGGFVCLVLVLVFVVFFVFCVVWFLFCLVFFFSLENYFRQQKDLDQRADEVDFDLSQFQMARIFHMC